jgi:hypothetical protein
MGKRIWGIASIVAATVLVNVAAASAADLYVDDSGDDGGGNDCTAPAQPCETIQYAADRPATDDVIHLGGGTYDETIVLSGTESLIEDSTFSGAASGAAVINATSTDNANPAIIFDSTGTVSGLTIRSVHNAVFVRASGTLSGNTFDDGSALGQYEADVVVMTGFFPTISPTISGNFFHDPTPTGSGSAIILNAAGSPTVSNNSITDYNVPVQAFTGSPTGITATITGNEIGGTHSDGPAGFAILLSNGVFAELTTNRIHSPGVGSPDGVVIVSNTGNVDAEFHRNEILGHRKGVAVSGNPDPITMDSDLIAGSTGIGLTLDQNASDDGAGADVTNATIIGAGSASDIAVFAGTTLNLDSSIVGVGPPSGGVNGVGGTCTITYSRGAGAGVGDCDTGFITTDDPMFVNPAANDYHLQSGSPMIDAGNDAAPSPLALDVDGDPRALAVAAPCTTPPAGTRDIGADEFVTFCPPPVLTPKATPQPVPPAKKCKKGQKLKKGKCVKKRKKKKKR